MKKWMLILMLLCSVNVPAQQWLPPHDAVHMAIDAQPNVAASRARLEAAQAQARALQAGTHEFQLGVISQRRSTDELAGRQRFSESEVSLSRAFRLPGKARLDRDLSLIHI